MRQNNFAPDDALIGNGQTYPNFKYIHPKKLHCVLQTLIEISSVERI